MPHVVVLVEATPLGLPSVASVNEPWPETNAEQINNQHRMVFRAKGRNT
jgi:hypothetical protein